MPRARQTLYACFYKRRDVAGPIDCISPGRGCGLYPAKLFENLGRPGQLKSKTTTLPMLDVLSQMIAIGEVAVDRQTYDLIAACRARLAEARQRIAVATRCGPLRGAKGLTRRMSYRAHRRGCAPNSRHCELFLRWERRIELGAAHERERCLQCDVVFGFARYVCL